jgi:PHP family Zn ribbon phosphoesterase
MTLPYLWEWSRRKGIDLIATGDWTHPLWINEIKQNLEEEGNGLLKLKNKPSKNNDYDPSFFLSGEVSCIYSQGGKGRRVHLLIFSPSLATCEKINKELIKRGCNLSSDGRPIIGISSIEFADIALSIDEKCLIVPAHAWTPWFGLYGSESGFDSLDECFGKFAPVCQFQRKEKAF